MPHWPGRAIRPDQRMNKLTTRAKRALRLADEEAQRLHQHSIDTPHLLLGLVREGEGVASTVLHRHGVELGALREAVAVTAPSDTERRGAAATPRAIPSAGSMLERAYDEAGAMGHKFVGTEHLLLALLHEDDGAAPRLLRGLGVDPDSIGADLVDAVATGGRGFQSRGPKDNVVTCRVEDSALDAIDALIEAGIRSTRSDAAAWLIRSGIEANREFFEQVYATVGEIRRLREQAQALARQSPTRQDNQTPS